MRIFITGLLLTVSALASNDLAHRPRSFSSSVGKAVFVDFTEATYDISYDVSGKEALVVAWMKFNAPEAGHVIFDSVTAPTSIELDGTATSAIETQTPDKVTTVRVVRANASEGSHTLKIALPLTEMVEFLPGGIKSAFWTSDLSEREFLEYYMPASFEYDQLKIVFNVKFSGLKNKQAIYTNGVVESIGENSYRITYPSYYNVSSIFYHTVPQSAVDEVRYSLKSIDGREIPVVIYVSKGVFGGSTALLQKFRTEATNVFRELESDYGAWPHPSLTIYNAGRGGMEYCGATMTEFRALGHEMFHSYFARGVMPANGNSGWLDEALASWRDEGYLSLTKLTGTSMMSSHPYYNRVTDRDAYSFGENFMRLMEGKLKSQGGLKPFMRHMVESKTFAPLFVEEFISDMEEFYDAELESDFKKYTFGTSSDFKVMKPSKSPMHQKMSIKELRSYL